MNLIDHKCLAALKKCGFEKTAESLAKQANELGAATASVTLGFLEKDEECSGEFMATITVTVERV